jgi:hypothetical protein
MVLKKMQRSYWAFHGLQGRAAQVLRGVLTTVAAFLDSTSKAPFTR